MPGESDPGSVPGPEELGLRLAAQALAIEYFARIDRRDLDGALGLYAEDAVFLGVRGRDAIRAVAERGLAANAAHPTRHVVANLTASAAAEPGSAVVRFTALAYTLAAGERPRLRTVLDQQMRVGRQPEGRMRITEHQIPGYDPAS
jgi:hypothetical protein